MDALIVVTHRSRAGHGSGPHSPPWFKEGGRAIKKISPQASFERRGRRGWFNLREDLFGDWTNHRLRRQRWLRSIFFLSPVTAPSLSKLRKGVCATLSSRHLKSAATRLNQGGYVDRPPCPAPDLSDTISHF